MPAALPVINMSEALCCEPLGSRQFDQKAGPAEVAARLRVLADANRIRIVQELSCCEGHHLTSGEIAALLDVSPATASHHVKLLENAGILVSQRDGTHVHYRLNFESVRAISAVLNVGCGAACDCG